MNTAPQNGSHGGGIPPAPGSGEGFTAEVLSYIEEQGFPLDTVMCAIDHHLVIRWANEAWNQVAIAAPHLRFPKIAGRRITDGIAPPLDRFYRQELYRTLDDDRVWRHEYLCPTPELQQVFNLVAHPLRRHRGLVLVHELVHSHPHRDALGEIELDSYRDQRGVIRLCGHCRAARRHGLKEQWDFVPELLAPNAEPLVFNTLCPTCAVHYERLGDAVESPRSQRPPLATPSK